MNLNKRNRDPSSEEATTVTSLKIRKIGVDLPDIQGTKSFTGLRTMLSAEILTKSIKNLREYEKLDSNSDLIKKQIESNVIGIFFRKKTADQIAAYVGLFPDGRSQWIRSADCTCLPVEEISLVKIGSTVYSCQACSQFYVNSIRSMETNKEKSDQKKDEVKQELRNAKKEILKLTSNIDQLKTQKTSLQNKLRKESNKLSYYKKLHDEAKTNKRSEWENFLQYGYNKIDSHYPVDTEANQIAKESFTRHFFCLGLDPRKNSHPLSNTILKRSCQLHADIGRSNYLKERHWRLELASVGAMQRYKSSLKTAANNYNTNNTDNYNGVIIGNGVENSQNNIINQNNTDIVNKLVHNVDIDAAHQIDNNDYHHSSPADYTSDDDEPVILFA